VERLARYTPEEKLEIIRLVEHSDLSVKQTLSELQVPRSSFYAWYKRYQEEGPEGLHPRKPKRKQFWNKIPDKVNNQIVELALERHEESPRQLAYRYIDEKGYFVSESSVYRLLKRFDLIQSPAFEVITAKDKFENPTKRVNEMWQTDFTYFKVIGWGWYYLSTVLDDYSRFILAFRLSTTMNTRDVELTLEDALAKTGVQNVKVYHRPRLLSDNGSAYRSKQLKEFLKPLNINHIRGRPYHPMTQGKIERWHRSMKNVIKLQNYYFPWELEQAIAKWVHYYNNDRYHESLENVTPADVFYGKEKEVLKKRNRLKEKTMALRRQNYLHVAGV
jgi:transposase InsO family protein